MCFVNLTVTAIWKKEIINVCCTWFLQSLWNVRCQINQSFDDFFFFFCCHDKQTDEIEMDEKLTPQPLTLWHISERSYTVCFRTTPRNAQKFRNLAISVADQFHVIWYVNQEMFCVSSLFLYIILHACTHTAFLVWVSLKGILQWR